MRKEQSPFVVYLDSVLIHWLQPFLLIYSYPIQQSTTIIIFHSGFSHHLMYSLSLCSVFDKWLVSLLNLIGTNWAHWGNINRELFPKTQVLLLSTAFSVWISSFQSFFSASYVSPGWFDRCVSSEKLPKHPLPIGCDLWDIPLQPTRPLSWPKVLQAFSSNAFNAIAKSFIRRSGNAC